MKKKILFCTASYTMGFGGVASYAHDFVNAFSHKYLFSIVCGTPYLGEDNGCPVYYIPHVKLSKRDIERFLEVVEIEKPDIIINSNYAIAAVVAPYLDDNIRVFSISHFTNGKLAWRAGLNGNWTDGIVALSSYAKEFLIKSCGVTSPNKIDIIYNTMPSIPKVDIKQKRISEPIKIVYPGGRSYKKSSEVVYKTLLKLIKTDLNFEFYWIGHDILPFAKLKFAPVKRICDCLPHDIRIKRVGRVEREESKEILSEANVFLLPSRGEGFPISLLEAMRGGCIPVISDAHHGSLEVIKDNVNGFVAIQGSSKSLFSKLENLIKNHKNYVLMYDKNIELFEKELESSIWIKRMDDFLERPQQHKMRGKINWGKIRRDKLILKMVIFYEEVVKHICNLYLYLIFLNGKKSLCN